MSSAAASLTAAGIVTRVPYREPGSRARDEYRLTAAGEELLPVLLSLTQWGDAHLQDGRGGPLEFVDAGTGRTVHVCVTADDPEPARSGGIRIRVAEPGQPLK